MNDTVDQFRSVVVGDFLGDAVRRAIDCRDLQCMRNEPVEEIMRAQSSLMGIPRSVGDFFPWAPILTGEKHLGIIPGANRWDRTVQLDSKSLFSVESYARQRESTKYAVNVSQPLEQLHQVPDEIPIIIGTNKHEGEMFVHSAFPITMSKAVYWMFVGALFKDSSSKVLRHYRPYVAQLEREAKGIAEKQILEEENKQFYLEHQQDLEQEYEWLLLQNSTNAKDIITPETVERLIRTFSSGGGPDGMHISEVIDSDNNGTKAWWRNILRSRNATDERVSSVLIPSNETVPWWKQVLQRKSLDPAIIQERQQQREERIKAKSRARALKEAAKVVIDYRPVMSRIINDYLFRCPSWHYAHHMSHNRVQKQKTNNVYVYRFSQPTHVPGYKECWGKVSYFHSEISSYCCEN